MHNENGLMVCDTIDELKKHELVAAYGDENYIYMIPKMKPNENIVYVIDKDTKKIGTMLFTDFITDIEDDSIKFKSVSQCFNSLERYKCQLI